MAEELLEAAAAVVRAHLGVQPGERVVVVTDEARRDIGMALFGAAQESGAEAMFIEMIERPNHGAEPPGAVAAAMLEGDVILLPTSKSLSHTAARKAASDTGARIASMPLITEDMMIRALRADPARLKRLGAAYAQALTEGETARLTAPGGTDCMFELAGREAISDDGDLTAAGAFGNLPAGEAFIAPVEGKTEGVIVFDGSLSPDGAVAAPVTVEVSGGRAVDVTGGPVPLFASLPEDYGPDAWEVAELGIGTNDRAIVTGNILEDEKVASTVHVAFGNNATIGGVTQVASHHDGVILDATLEIDGEVILRGGDLLLA